MSAGQANFDRNHVLEKFQDPTTPYPAKMEAVLGSFAWHAGAVETVRALGLETSIALAVFLVVVLVVTGVCIVHEERKRKRSSTLRIAAGKKES